MRYSDLNSILDKYFYQFLVMRTGMDVLLVDYTYFAWTLPMSWSDKGGVPGIDKKNLQSQCISMGFYSQLTHKQYYLF